MHSIYLRQTFVLDHIVVLAANSTPGGSYQLGKGVRKVILSFTIWTINNYFPFENHEYILFIVRVMKKIVLVSRRNIVTTVNFITVTCFVI